MANRFIHSLRRAHPTSFLHSSSSTSHPLRSIIRHTQSLYLSPKHFLILDQWKSTWGFRNFSHGLVNVVISNGKPKLEAHETEPPKKEKWRTKKRLKMQRKREKQMRKSANTRDPRRLRVKGKKMKQKFHNVEEKLKYKIEKAKMKEALLIGRLKRYEVRRQQGPVVEPQNLTGEERFYMQKMAQKRSNYVPVGRRGVFGGVILNMHLHWKKHETVEVICKPCKPGQVHEYAKEISRLSGGIPIRIIGNDTIIFYRGKNYVQPEVMSPIDTLSKKKALEKSKYEQSLESVRHFIAIAEKELELYYKHVALYGDPNEQSSYPAYTSARTGSAQLGDPYKQTESYNSITDDSSTDISDADYNAADQKLQADGNLSGPETVDYESLSDFSVDSEDEGGTSNLHGKSASTGASFSDRSG